MRLLVEAKRAVRKLLKRTKRPKKRRPMPQRGRQIVKREKKKMSPGVTKNIK